MKKKIKAADRLAHLLEIIQELDRIHDLDFLLERLLSIARREMQADAGTLYIYENKKLVFKHSQNDTFQAKLSPGEKLIYSHFSIPINDSSIAGFAATHRTMLNIPNMYAIKEKAPYHFDPSFDQRTGYKTVSSLTIPLISSDNELLGVMQLINALNVKGQAIAFKKDDESSFGIFASFGSKSIQRAQMTRNLLLTLTRFASMRDPKETGAHVTRVGAYATEIYEAWAYRKKISVVERDKSKDILRMAAMLHDVGKVAISDLILKKPGRLEKDEYRIMQSHTWKGAQQFLDKTQLNKIASEVALHHHENWDGSGYPGNIGDLDKAEENQARTKENPQGLKKEEIPLFARIVSIADVYDALCSKRTYKIAWSEEKTLQNIRQESGRKFDPELVDIFFSILPTLRNIRKNFPDIA